MKTTILVLVIFASIAHGADVPLFPDRAFERRWYSDPGAISFGFADSPHSSSPTPRERATYRYSLTRLVVLRCAPSLSSDSQFAFALQQFTPALLTPKPILADYIDNLDNYVYDGEPELSASSVYLTTQSFGSQEAR